MCLIRPINTLNSIIRSVLVMQISNLSIENFRNLSGVTVNFSDDINSIVGENNIGKSNLLQLVASVLTGRKFDEIDFYDKNKPLIVSFSLKLSDEEIGIFDDYFDPENHNLINIIAEQVSPDEYINYKHKESGNAISRMDIVNNLNVIVYDSLRNPKTEITFEKTKGVGLFLNYIIKKYLSKGDSTLYLVEDKINHLNDYIESILEKLSCFKKFDITSGISNDSSKLLPKIFELYGTNNIPFERSGYGVQFNILILLSILEKILRYSEKRGASDKKTFSCIIAFDEPEIHLSPFLQRSILHDIKKIAKGEDGDFNAIIKELFDIDAFSAQILLTTHSRELIENDYKKIIRLYKDNSLVRAISGTNVVIETEEKHWYKELTYIKEAMFAKKIILIEGDSEQGAIYGFAKMLGINLDAYDVSVVKASGANNILPLAYLFEKFKIQPVLIFDKDKYDEFSSTSKQTDITHFKDCIFVTKTKCFDSEMVFNLYTEDGVAILEEIKTNFGCTTIQKTAISSINRQYNLNPKLEEQDCCFSSYTYPSEILKYMYIAFFQKNKTIAFGEYIGDICAREFIPECYKNAILKAIE